nr:hypothetical protein [Methylocapsa sp. RX1]
MGGFATVRFRAGNLEGGQSVYGVAWPKGEWQESGGERAKLPFIHLADGGRLSTYDRYRYSSSALRYSSIPFIVPTLTLLVARRDADSQSRNHKLPLHQVLYMAAVARA